MSSYHTRSVRNPKSLSGLFCGIIKTWHPIGSHPSAEGEAYTRERVEGNNNLHHSLAFTDYNHLLSGFLWYNVSATLI
jgi:hypothetical protein